MTDRQPDAALEVLKVIENALEIPHYAFGDNEAACSMRSALELAAAFVRSEPSAPSVNELAAAREVANGLRRKLEDQQRLNDALHDETEMLRAKIEREDAPTTDALYRPVSVARSSSAVPSTEGDRELLDTSLPLYAAPQSAIGAPSDDVLERMVEAYTSYQRSTERGLAQQIEGMRLAVALLPSSAAAPVSKLTMPSMDAVQMACGEFSANEFRAVKATLEWFVRSSAPTDDTGSGATDDGAKR